MRLCIVCKKPLVGGYVLCSIAETKAERAKRLSKRNKKTGEPPPAMYWVYEGYPKHPACPDPWATCIDDEGFESEI